MKRPAAVLGAALIALSLSACSVQSAVPTATPAPSPVVQEEQTGGARPVLTYFPEGEETSIPAVEQKREGYRITVPVEGWTLENGTWQDSAADLWRSPENETVWLRVVTLPGMDLEQAQEAIRTGWPEADLLVDAQGGMGGTMENGQMLDVRFLFDEENAYAVMLGYPLEAAEGFGGLLSVMADTVTLE